MAESKNFTFLQVLKFKNFEFWESRLHQPSLLAKGDLQVLYSHLLDLVVLKIHNSTFLLQKDLQIIGTLDQQHGWLAYTLATPGGFFVLKNNDIDHNVGLDNGLINFETILESRANFVRSNNLIGKLGSFKVEHKSTSEISNIANSMMHAVTDLVDMLSHSENVAHPNQRLRLGLDELLGVESNAVPIVDISESELNLLKETTNLVTRDHQGLGDWKDLWTSNSESSISRGVDLLNLASEQKTGLQSFGQPGVQRKASTGQEKVGESGYHDQKEAPQGKHHHDGQELLGGENQRLPSYEIHQSTKLIHDGFGKASSNVANGETGANDEVEKDTEEESEFTTGLMKGDVPSDLPATPYHKNEQENVPDLQPKTEKKDLPKESLNMQSWGSNVSNPSETVPVVESDFGKATSGSKKDLQLPEPKINNTVSDAGRPSKLSAEEKITNPSETSKDIPAA